MNATELPIHDIVDTPLTTIWPLAWGWWVLAAVLISGVAIAIHAFLRHRRRHTPKRIALSYFEHPQPTLSAINQLAKRVALAYFPAHKVASLQGESWHQFLVKTYPQAIRDTFNQQLSVFTALQYQSVNENQVMTYQALMTDWVKNALPPREKEDV